MLLKPGRSKFKKQQKGKSFKKIYGKICNLTKNATGSVCLKAISCGRITSNQIESVRQLLSKNLKKLGKIKVSIFPDTPITKKPIEVRMGKGKGAVDHWIFKVKPGFVLYEIETSYISLALKSLKLSQVRLPIKTRIFCN